MEAELDQMMAAVRPRAASLASLADRGCEAMVAQLGGRGRGVPAGRGEAWYER